jgi:hypothetical protein
MVRKYADNGGAIGHDALEQRLGEVRRPDRHQDCCGAEIPDSHLRSELYNQVTLTCLWSVTSNAAKRQGSPVGHE